MSPYICNDRYRERERFRSRHFDAQAKFCICGHLCSRTYVPGTCNVSDGGFCTISFQKRNGNYPSEKTKEVPISAVMMQRHKPVFGTVWISAG